MFFFPFFWDKSFTRMNTNIEKYSADMPIKNKKQPAPQMTNLCLKEMENTCSANQVHTNKNTKTLSKGNNWNSSNKYSKIHVLLELKHNHNCKIIKFSAERCAKKWY